MSGLLVVMAQPDDESMADRDVIEIIRAQR
jgi:hypothetical protein